MPRVIATGLATMLALGLVACGSDDDGDAGTTSDSGATSGSQVAGFQPAPLEVSGSGPELREAAEAVHAFFVARASDEWDATCSRVAEPLLEKLESLAARSEQEGCEELLEAFTTPMSEAAWQEITAIDATDLRIDGDRASLVYRGAGDEVYSIPLREEGGEWKVEALEASPSG